MDVRVWPCERLAGVITANPSKNYTSRYLFAAALAGGESIVRNPATSEDSEALQRCLQQLGAELRWEGRDLRVRGFGGRPQPVATLNPGNAGLVLRLLLGLGALLPDTLYVTDYADSLGQRPHGDLLDVLEQLGVNVEARPGGRLPIRLQSSGRVRGGQVSVSGDISSQFLTALLFLAPLLPDGLDITVTGHLKSAAAVRQTVEVLEQAGIAVTADAALRRFQVPGGQTYEAGEFRVPGDYPGSAAILAAAAATRSDVTIQGLYRDSQGERAIVDVLQAMGAAVSHDGERVHVQSDGNLRAVEFDGDKATDAVLAMAAAATVAAGTSRFYNVENLRYKECDRISDYGAELRRLGARVGEERAALLVTGQPEGLPGGVVADSRIDHRVVMGLTIAGLRCHEPVTIRRAEHVAKSYPQFFEHVRALGGRVEIV